MIQWCCTQQAWPACICTSSTVSTGSTCGPGSMSSIGSRDSSPEQCDGWPPCPEHPARAPRSPNLARWWPTCNRCNLSDHSPCHVQWPWLWTRFCHHRTQGNKTGKTRQESQKQRSNPTSSSSRTRGWVRIARAMAMRCRCPPDKRTPRSPTLVWYPWGKAEMKSCALANLAASSTCSDQLAHRMILSGNCPTDSGAMDAFKSIDMAGKASIVTRTAESYTHAHIHIGT